MFIGILFIKASRSAQNYQTGIGARFGGLTSGITVKHFVSNTSAFEEALGLSPNGGNYYNDHRLYTSSTVAAAATQNLISLTYTFKDPPLTAGPDFKPFIDFFNGSTMYFDGGISLGYAF